MPINGKRFGWEDLTVFMPIGLMIDLKEIEYDTEMEVEHAYGQGSAPRGWQRGNWKGEGKMTMSREQYDLLLEYCRSQGRTIYTLPPFRITAAYVDDEGEIPAASTDQLLGCKIKKSGKKAAQGDKSVDVELEFIFEDLEENGVSQNADLTL